MLLPFVIAFATLGLGFDRYSSQTTLFPIYVKQDVEKNTQITPHTSIMSRFIVPKSSSEVNTFLNLDPEFSLLSKRNELDIPAYSNYIKALIDRDASVDILFLVRVITETHSFPSSLKLDPEWQNQDPNLVGTHYIKGLEYGGIFLGYFKALVKNPQDVKEIKASVEKYIGTAGNISEIVQENIDKLEEEIGYKVLATRGHHVTGLETFPGIFSLKSMVKAALNYPALLKEGRNVAVGMELEDLSTINKNYTKFTKNEKLDPMLLELDEKYDDVRIAFNKFLPIEGTTWACTTEVKIMIEEYHQRLRSVYDALSMAISEMDITGSGHQFDLAFDIYGKGAGSDKFRRELDVIMEHWNKSCKNM